MVQSYFNCNLGSVEYPVYIGNVLEDLDSLVANVYQGSKIFLLIDQVIDSRYGSIIYPQLEQKYIVHKHVLKGGKDSKTIASALEILNELNNKNFSRDSLIIGIGGGVIGDMNGFVASCWYRGMKMLHIPTTLLSAVDSCVGGKTAINLGDTVNAIGSYYHPISILIDLKILEDLPERELASGMAEVVKYAAIHSKKLHSLLDKISFDEIQDHLDFIIRESLQTKTVFVRGDITEAGRRLYLNFGHTLGHAVEFATVLDGIETLRHGEAVSLGMVSIFKISQTLGYISEKDVSWIKNLLTKFNLPICYSAEKLNSSRKEVINDCMKLVVKDKKRKFDVLRLIVLNSIGEPIIMETNDMALLQLGFEEIIHD